MYWGGEMTIVAYGRNEALGVCRTEHVHPTLLSVAAQQVLAAISLAATWFVLVAQLRPCSAPTGTFYLKIKTKMPCPTRPACLLAFVRLSVSLSICRAPCQEVGKGCRSHV